MYIIFADDVTELEQNHTLLELDTFRFGDQRHTSWCVIDHVPLSEVPVMDRCREIHQQLMIAYRTQQWDTCRECITALQGRWDGELDTFYDSLLQRVDQAQGDPPEVWDPDIVKSIDSASTDTNHSLTF